MIMKLLLIFMLVTFINANELCDKYYSMYNIDPYIKSKSGWERSIKNKTIYNYFSSSLSDNEVNRLQNCLLTDSIDIKQYNRSIGVKR